MIIILWTCANIEEARAISSELVEKRLVACANIIPHIESIYEWEDNIETAQEAKVFLKTVKEKFNSVKALIIKKCSYDVPEVTALDVDMVNSDYLDWVKSILL